MPEMTSWPELLEALLSRKSLTSDTARAAMRRLMSGELADAEIAGFLVALRAKGETGPELRGLSDAMLDEALSISVPGPALDIVGTGGDQLGTVNISTMSSLVAVGAGARVIKHGNRGASSTAGAADVIEALGVDLDLPIDRVAQSAEQVGITFLFAQVFHPAMRHVMLKRAEHSASGQRSTSSDLSPIPHASRPRRWAAPPWRSPRRWQTPWPPAEPEVWSSGVRMGATR